MATHASKPFGRGRGPILMDNVNCQGGEEDLNDCDSSEWRENDCNHSEDAGVICSTPLPPGTYARYVLAKLLRI